MAPVWPLSPVADWTVNIRLWPRAVPERKSGRRSSLNVTKHSAVTNGYLQNGRFLNRFSLHNTALGGDSQTLPILSTQSLPNSLLKPTGAYRMMFGDDFDGVRITASGAEIKLVPGGSGKRAMAQDMAEVMTSLGQSECLAVGHDRGARVTHRMALDYPDRVKKACLMDIAPTYQMFRATDQHLATGYYYWFILIQPDGLPEHLIGADPAYYLTEKRNRWSAPGAALADETVAEYTPCFSNPEASQASW
jgi:pimeloyl-ACP methyl ester carboxylesterase